MSIIIKPIETLLTIKIIRLRYSILPTLIIHEPRAIGTFIYLHNMYDYILQTCKNYFIDFRLTENIIILMC